MSTKPSTYDRMALMGALFDQAVKTRVELDKLIAMHGEAFKASQKAKDEFMARFTGLALDDLLKAGDFLKHWGAK